MIEKVNPSHPDKIADRIAGAIVDLAYQVQDDPKVAVEVLIGHGVCHAVVETSAPMLRPEVLRAIHNAIHRTASLGLCKSTSALFRRTPTSLITSRLVSAAATMASSRECR